MSPNQAYQRSAQREREVRAAYEALGFFAIRAAGSKGCVDVLAVKDGEIVLCQVKTGGSSAYAGFPPSDRDTLAEAARQAGGRALLYWYPKGGGLNVIPQEEWPDGR